MAADPNQLIMGMLQSAGLGRTGSDFVQQDGQIAGQQLQNQALQMKLAQAAQEQQRQQQYQQDVNSYFADPHPERLAQLAAKYPDQADALKQVYTTMDAARKSSLQTTYGSLNSAANNGRSDLVMQQLRALKAAEQAQGVGDTSETDDALAELASGDPARVKAALKSVTAFTGMHLAAIDPSRFSENLAAVGTADGPQGTKGQVVGRSIGHYDDNGKWVVDYRDPDKPEYRSVPVYDTSGNKIREDIVAVGGSEGGGQASGAGGAPSGSTTNAPRYTGPQIEQMAQGAVPGIGVSSRVRSRETQQRLFDAYQAYKSGNGPWAPVAAPPDHSGHQNAAGEDLARDFVPPKGMTLGQLGARLRDTFPGAQILNEGNHIHVGPMPGGMPSRAPASQSGGPQVVYHGQTVPASGDGGLSDDEVNFYAQRVAGGGDLPTLGMGKQAAQLRQKILAKAADISIDNGIGGAQANLLHAQLKANTHSLSTLTNLRTQIAASEDTASRNADQVLQLAPRGVGGSVPVFNRWIQSGRTNVTADPVVSRFNLALDTVANEYAKVMTTNTGSGGQTSDSARAEAHRLFNNAQTLDQLRNTIAQMRIDMRNRTAALATQDSILRGNIGSPMGGRPATPSRGWGRAQVIH